MKSTQIIIAVCGIVALSMSIAIAPTLGQAPAPCQILLPDAPGPRGVYVTNLWPGGVVPYEFATNVAQANRDAMLVAMNAWQAVANVTFRTPVVGTDANWVHIQDSSGNNSWVGMQGGSQVINIHDWLTYYMAHELGHAMGLWHEQQRNDRGSYITINFANIDASLCAGDCGNQTSCVYANFCVQPNTYDHGPYDFDSVMHYWQWAFSTCPSTLGCETITVRPPNESQQNLIGQGGFLNHLSAGDARTMAYLYPCAAWRQRSPATSPAARDSHAMCYDAARGVTVLFGGTSNGGASGNSETWEWDGTSWILRSTAGPSARDQHAMAYDSARGVTVLFGGRPTGGGSVNGETWEWNGTTWLLRSTTGPSARRVHAMAYDSTRHVTVLFGGFTIASNGETWEWNGTTWTQQFPANSPSPRYSHAMAYDSARAVTVLFGGYTTSNNGETWEWNGTTWTPRPATAPSARRLHALAFDAARGVTVLFGGFSNSGSSNETWEWDGSAWIQRLVNGPSARYGHAIAYDATRGVAMLFGGYGASDNGDTWQYGVARGDVNSDGAIDGADIQPFVELLLGADASECRGAPGDMNGDGIVDIADVSLFVMALLGNVPCCPATNLSLNLATGVDGNGNFIPAGNDDDDWIVTLDASGGTVPRPASVVTPDPAWTTIPGSRWISANFSGPNGNYGYRFCFCLDERYRNPSLTLQVRADDACQVFLNSNFIGDGATHYAPSPATITTSNPAFFQPGENCVTVVAQNLFGPPTGFSVAGTATAEDGECCCPP